MESNTSPSRESQVPNEISPEYRREIEREADRNVYNGGRALNAVFYAEHLTPPERLILLFLGSEMDFNGEFGEYVPVTRSILAKRLGYKKTASVDAHIKSLEDRGYISVIKKLDHTGVWDPEGNEYRITKRFFEDYADWLVRQQIEHGVSPKSTSYKRTGKHAELGSAEKRTRGSAKNGLGVVPKTDPFYSYSSPQDSKSHTHTPRAHAHNDQQKPAEKIQEPKTVKPETPLEKVTDEYLEKLRELGTTANRSLLRHNLGLVNQNLRWTWERLSSMRDEIVGYLCGRRSHVASDVGHDLYKFCQNYREPKPDQKGKYTPPKPRQYELSKPKTKEQTPEELAAEWERLMSEGKNDQKSDGA